jgi:hypothetical protein
MTSATRSASDSSPTRAVGVSGLVRPRPCRRPRRTPARIQQLRPSRSPTNASWRRSRKSTRSERPRSFQSPQPHPALGLVQSVFQSPARRANIVALSARVRRAAGRKTLWISGLSQVDTIPFISRDRPTQRARSRSAGPSRRVQRSVSKRGDQSVEKSNCADKGGTLGLGAPAKRSSPIPFIGRRSPIAGRGSRSRASPSSPPLVCDGLCLVAVR